ncbi:type I-E CRISPR-associated endonuclease Cas1e [Streptomyces thermodiastaticus]|jgi:CRISPR-associated protein Cas1|uniref:type I-E CRISPR-associated endonuclease Cas1e n=1 Tax=Streptomyces thermodiastaticus TaxID=44061 RepID=UPI00167997C8|nr:type I-E CRISPR-associated endonuclease Cas1e [Streptomyces thermodiastaticus]MCE7549270.1 type I-E CRISPR-associated endonuclease Cas1e [Streptomyces thermodiastaticus]GHF61414.1 CRISPR-associated endonuclease Cas1 [Streptomyces thermodiastaticus]
MSTISRRAVSTPQELTRAGDRISFIYLERCTVHREDNAITATDADGVTHIPSATIGTLLLGPGTRVTHQAMSVLGECGAGVVWVGEQGVRFYAGGRALTRSSRLVEAQATAWANRRTRLAVARAMYRMRFPDDDPSARTRQELLSREGRRVKECYRREAARTGVPWRRREYHHGDFSAGDPANQAVTAAAQCMYGIAHAVVCALGCSPGLGFVHSGHERSFVLDIADLYKTEIAIPAAFDAAAQGEDDVATRTRRALRDRINRTGLLDRCVQDIETLLLPHHADGRDAEDTTDQVALQTDDGYVVPGGRNYDGTDAGAHWREEPIW